MIRILVGVIIVLVIVCVGLLYIVGSFAKAFINIVRGQNR